VVFGSAWFGLFSAIMTLMILFLSEIIPKTLGAVYWRSLSGLTAVFVRALILALYPLIRLSEVLTRWIARGRKVHAFNREEFVAMASLGEQTGHLRQDESRILRNLFQLESLQAKDVMTPRTVVRALQQDLTIAEALAEKANTSFSRMPLYGRDVDDVTGFVLKSDMLLAQARGEGDLRLEGLKREIHLVVETMALSDLLELLLERRQHVALVIDEYGGTQGLVTLEDVVETLLGMEIVDEADKAQDMQILARRQWAKRAAALGLDIAGREKAGR
jgi:CBS domain containing-hemolysin-like protein